MKNLKFKCTSCIKNMQINNISTYYKILDKNAKSNYVLQCLKCNTIKTVGYQSLEKNNFKCYVCSVIDKSAIIKNHKLKPLTYSPFSYTCTVCNDNFDEEFNTLQSRNFKCQTCYPYYTKEEYILKKWLDTCYSDVTVIYNKPLEEIHELDLYFPQYNFAVEINGLAFHSTPNVFGNILSKDKHKDKFKLCNDKGIQLLQITDWDIHNNIELIKSMILNKINRTPHKIYARKCTIEEFSTSNLTNNPKAVSVIKRFIDKNHLQRQCDAKHKLGLFYNNKLVAAMLFSSSGELVRYCQVKYTNVIGGFSKLLKYAIKNYNFQEITTFSDNMYSNGDVYNNNGFIEEYEIPVDYKYYKVFEDGLIYKSNFMKSKIKNNPSMIYEDGLTENELMLLNGYSRYCDAGKIKWKYIGV